MNNIQELSSILVSLHSKKLCIKKGTFTCAIVKLVCAHILDHRAKTFTT